MKKIICAAVILAMAAGVMFVYKTGESICCMSRCGCRK